MSLVKSLPASLCHKREESLGSPFGKGEFRGIFRVPIAALEVLKDVFS
jgi:hypothetical protein